MARHLIVGDGVAYGISNGLYTDGAVTIEKKSDNGPVPLALGDTFADSPYIRIVQGGYHGKNIYTPWIYGKDVIDYSGKSYSAALPHQHTVTIANTAGSAGEVVIKFVRKDGVKPEFFSFTTEIPNGTAHTAADALVKAAYEAATLPDWLEDTCDATAGATVVFEGAVRGDVAQSGNTWEYGPAIFDVIVESYSGTTQTYTATASGSATQNAFPGIGDNAAVANFEKELRGTAYGFYNRLELPNTPVAQVQAGTNYNMFNIVATKDGSSHSQIHGVDNLIEISLALKTNDANTNVVQNILNGYFIGVFPSLILA
tara:strand:+ start:1207 stop:2148 length:942 start_codon:yes stop_codon:yes gene_type:complete